MLGTADGTHAREKTGLAHRQRKKDAVGVGWLEQRSTSHGLARACVVVVRSECISMRIVAD